MNRSLHARLCLFLLAALLLSACGRDRPAEQAPFAAQRPGAQRPGTGIENRAGTVAPAAPGAPLNLLTERAGPLRVSFGDLRRAGIVDDPAQLDGLGLTHQGRPVPVLVDGAGQDAGLIFVAEAAESAYTRQNVYRLAATSSPLRPAQMDPAVLSLTPAGADSFIDHLLLEENLRHNPLPETGERWFWSQVRPRQPQTIAFDLPGLAPSASHPATFTLSLWSPTANPSVDPDHHLTVTVNGTLVADLFWEGSGWQRISGEIPAGLLVGAGNSMVIDLPGDAGGPNENSLIDSIHLAYPRSFLVEKDGGPLAFVGPGGGVTLAGLKKDALLLDVTEPDAWQVARLPETGPVGTERGRRYVAALASALAAPVAILPVADQPLLRNRPAGADYLVIGPADLLAAAAPLLDYRRDQGLTPLAVPIQRIYDDFAHGLADPQAVQAFLAHAVETWSPPPRYVLLLGDATYDPKGFVTGLDANRLPAFWVYTLFGGETVTDLDFVRLDEDPLPDVALGRIPARTPEQVGILVQKILDYEADLPAGAGRGDGDASGAWRRRVLAVADGSEPSFSQDAQAFLGQLPGGYDLDLFAPGAGQADAGAETVKRVQSGDFAVAYFGHGSITQWGKDQLFTVDNSANLGNGDRLPILLNFTCLTGLFTHPTVESLTETLLWQADGGVIASLASTSLTLADDQSQLSGALADHLFTPPPPGQPLRLGDAFLAAQRQLPTDGQNALDVLNTFLLFGDPGLVVR